MNSIATLVLAPTFAWWRIKPGDRQPATTRKLALGLLLGGASNGGDGFAARGRRAGELLRGDSRGDVFVAGGAFGGD
ncbi:hypothetical protein [Amycolatopsis circi]|uniref:hypothetical protein n=1 Tax=Amycolatopsis circi TaxID=871959 RepID=UPI000E268F0D|nr:hypothetical protein [Amycolatopsis circi]